MRIWVTKYALTAGIQEVEADTVEESMAGYKDSSGWRLWVHGKDWHRTRDSAVERAEEMRVAKIASLKKSIAKLEKLSFTS